MQQHAWSKGEAYGTRHDGLPQVGTLGHPLLPMRLIVGRHRSNAKGAAGVPAGKLPKQSQGYQTVQYKTDFWRAAEIKDADLDIAHVGLHNI